LTESLVLAGEKGKRSQKALWIHFFDQKKVNLESFKVVLIEIQGGPAQ